MLAKTGSELPIYSNFSRSQDAEGELRDRLDRLPSAERVTVSLLPLPESAYERI